MRSILIVSDDLEVFRTIRSCFDSGSKVTHTTDRETALKALKKNRYDFLLIDVAFLHDQAGGDGYKTALHPFWQLYPTIEIIVMASQEMIREAVKAVKAGASDYLSLPINPEEVKYVTENIHESIIMQSELDYLRDRFWQSDAQEMLQTRNHDMKKAFDKIRSVAPTRSTVLLIGDTGTGKGVIARFIHRLSNRREEPFISVHCGAIPDTLVESELFGHEKGAFTGAIKRKLGKFEIAKGGTIFLDEVGTISPQAQIKLLQILQDRTFQRVGGEESLEADVRVIAASNMDLKKMCDEGQFRKDLYYRLNVFPIEFLSLRDRVEDIPLFVEAFLSKLNRYFQKHIHGIHPEVMGAFKKYAWPGNIRELENLMERAFILETTSSLSPESFPLEIFDVHSTKGASGSDAPRTLHEARRRGIEEAEESYLTDILTRHQGRIKQTAEAAGITPRQLNKLMTRYGLRKENFKDPTHSSR